MQDHVASPVKLLSLEGIVRPTTFVQPIRLATRLGVTLTIATETFQHTGSFKYRAAYHVAASVLQSHLITASSGNFGQALAFACRQLGKSCHVVMPATALPGKIAAVREFGGLVELIDVSKVSRAARVKALAAQFPEAYVASAYDDPYVIAGNATLGRELAASGQVWDCILAPVGGGGLTAGLVVGCRDCNNSTPIFGVEPIIANDAARSLRAGQLLSNETEPQTIADGVRTLSLGQRNWAILREGLAGLIEVTEEEIMEATELLYEYANLKAEPTGALAIAALLHDPGRFCGKAVCCVVSGGNSGGAHPTPLTA